LGLLAFTSQANARALELPEIYEFGIWVACVEECPAMPPAGATYDEFRTQAECVANCGHAPRLWEKNGVAPTDRVDHELALLEYQDAVDPTQALICYGDVENTVVIPGALCAGEVCEQMPECTEQDCELSPDDDLVCTDNEPGGPRCWWPDAKRPAACPDVVCDAQPTRTLEECSDTDGDGLPAWLEDFLDYLDPTAAQQLCGAGFACGFTQTCEYDANIGAGLCQTRDCGAGGCTAFHMELVAQDDQEILVHIFYDYTPVPARALDLFINYNQAALTLVDARPLAPLILQSKELAVSHLSDGTLRLSVFDTGGTHPVPHGPIIEMVFQRHVTGNTEIGFADDDLLQLESVAPLQGTQATQDELTDDSLWGEKIGIPTLAQITTRLRLWYGFDSVKAPLTYANVPTGGELCELIAECANEPDVQERQKMVSRLNTLQQPGLAGGESISGLSGTAVYLDGAADHVRMPVHYREPLAPVGQGFSMSTWFYTEGNSGNELKKTPQLLFSHMAFNERTRFGMALKPEGGGTASLVFFDGDLLSKAPKPAEVTVATGVQLRTWHHAGFALDAATGRVDIYLDGERVAEHQFTQPPAAVSCPQFFAGTDVVLHEEGNVLGGRPPELVYLAVSESNLYNIYQMDAAGLGRTKIIGDGQFSYRDPDYNPVLDRLVYSANVSGDSEIWIAKGDGTDRKQITVGFGDAYRGISARRPRWAPDGSGIVFESNIYNVLANDNSFARVKHLYYVGYDAKQNVVAIESQGGEVLTQLDYEALIAAQNISSTRLTGATLDQHHGNAQWLLGKSEADAHRGVLLVDAYAPGFDGHHVQRLTIGEYAALSTTEPLVGLGAPTDEIKLIAGHHSEKAAVPNPIVTERMIFERSQSFFTQNEQFKLTVKEDAKGFDVTVTHWPSGYDDNCWDSNFNTLKDTDEDRDQNDVWDKNDCYPYQVRNLYIEFDPAAYAPSLEDMQGNPKTPGALLKPIGQGGKNKSLKLVEAYPVGRAFVRVEVLSPLNALPLPTGEIAVVRFDHIDVEPAPQNVAFGAWSRQGLEELLVKDLTTVDAPVVFEPAGLFERVDQAVFSPDGDRLLLAAISKARPILLATESVATASGAAKVVLEPTRVRGLDWVRQDRFMACNWIGGYMHPQKKTILQGLRGGLDDLRVYSGLRDPDSFRSEAERGLEFLKNAGLDGQVDSKLPSCGNNHLECPPYHLCIESECKMVPCEPDDPYKCTALSSRCTLRPDAVEQEFTGAAGQDIFKWVCAADCNVDQQCFTQQCFNGPCRFCEQQTLTCIECRETIKNYGDLEIATVEGCPDQRSFRCEAGECVTDCYVYEDDQAIYLCDPALEYCEAGVCVLHDWDWWDVAPGSFSGGSEMRQTIAPDPGNGWHGYTQAVDQRVPIEITAYGVTDHGASPEIVVEVKGGPFYSAGWQRVGEVIVHSRTRIQAQNRPITLTIPHPFNDMRLRLVKSPYENVTAGASGLAGKDKDFCIADLEAIAAATGEPVDLTKCYRRAQGSKYSLGYRVGIPLHEAITACKDHGSAGCPSVAQGEFDYLYGGSPAAIVMDIQVDGGSAMNNITKNKVCAYGSYTDDALVPVDNGAPKKIFYGDIETEDSPERAQFCKDKPWACNTPGEFGLIDFDHDAKGFGLLNCNVYDPANQGERAQLLLSNIVIIKEWPAKDGAIVMDNGDVCTVEVNPLLNAPCYSLVGPSLDPANGVITQGPSLAYGSLDFSLFRSFGHAEGFKSQPLPKFPLKVKVEGTSVDGLQLKCGGKDPLLVDGTGVYTCPTQVKYGKHFQVEVTGQPNNPTQTCQAISGEGQMPKSAHTVTVYCGQVHVVSGAVQGLSGGKLKIVGYLSVDGSADSAVEAMTLVNNGAFSFKTKLPEHGTYDVVIKSKPNGKKCTVVNGSATMSDKDVTDIGIICVDVVDHKLQVAVGALEGKNLKLLEKTSGGVLTASTNGTHTFDIKLIEGDAYDIVITDLPTDPVQTCSVVKGKGTMPNSDHVGATVSCSTLPVYYVTGNVTGLTGEGLQLMLNGDETLTINAPADLTEKVTFKFKTPRIIDDDYEVVLAAQPNYPLQKCVVAAGKGVMTADGTPLMNVACAPVSDLKAFTLGGTVKGLKGSGLQLVLSGGVQKVDIAENGAWSFTNQVPDGAPYTVTVGQSPQNPWQTCTVTNDTGKVTDDISNIDVACEKALTVTVEMFLPDSDGGNVKAVLISNGPQGKIVAKSPDEQKLVNGKVLFQMAPANNTKKDPAKGFEVATLPGGKYHLYVYVNHDADFDGGKPNYAPGDYSGYAFFDATVDTPPTLTFEPGDMAFLGNGKVTAFAPLTGGKLTKIPRLVCYWAPKGNGDIPIPAGAYAPYVGKSLGECDDTGATDDDDEPCMGVFVTDVNPPIPGGTTYEITCWSDIDESGTLNTGDLYNSASAPPGPAAIGLKFKD